MAVEWIKMRSSLLADFKVRRIANLLVLNEAFCEWCSVTLRYEIRYERCNACATDFIARATISSLLAVWSSVNEGALADGIVHGMTLKEVDDIAGMPGFGSAMAEVEWLTEVEGGIQFPNFSEYNRPGKERSAKAKTPAERMKKSRDKKKAEKSLRKSATGCATVLPESDHRIDKIRDINTREIPPLPPKGGTAGGGAVGGGSTDAPPKPPRSRKPSGGDFDPGSIALPASLETPEFVVAWQAWCVDRRKRGKSLTEHAATLQLRRCETHGPELSIKAINASIENTWTKLVFDNLEGGTNGRSGTPRTQPARGRVAAIQTHMESRIDDIARYAERAKAKASAGTTEPKTSTGSEIDSHSGGGSQ